MCMPWLTIVSIFSHQVIPLLVSTDFTFSSTDTSINSMFSMFDWISLNYSLSFASSDVSLFSLSRGFQPGMEGLFVWASCNWQACGITPVFCSYKFGLISSLKVCSCCNYTSGSNLGADFPEVTWACAPLLDIFIIDWVNWGWVEPICLMWGIKWVVVSFWGVFLDCFVCFL